MNTLKESWFSELNDFWPGVALSLKVEEILHEEQTQFQKILVVKTKSHGRALMLDDIIQCTEKDEFSYHEMLSFLPLCSHPKPAKVLVIGGGDGGIVREVLKHPDVEHVTLVEIDGRVIEISKQYLLHLSSSLQNPKVNVIVGDGFEFLRRHTGEFDVIITDSSDPVGPAVCLFEKSYYELLAAALKPDGIVASQATTVWESLPQVKRTYEHCKVAFPVTAYAITAVPTYPSGQIGFIMGALNSRANLSQPLRVFSEEELDRMELKYYNDKIHQAAFVLPRFVEKTLAPRISKDK
ncbi:spermidine synthase [Odontomachus brunneus]|uniref:spermidine synthase n=1 Tax=Odontomachus brunneus TaxID=486640 RepID=UPI0013F252FB|nr:spermidine synthase [Odontomachus brunneus]XP_032666468.1 spermidine synthase [Odontomachus brunneus]